MGIRLSLYQVHNRVIQDFRAGNEDAAESVNGQSLDLDKSWAAIHFLLTGTKDSGKKPASSLLTGEEIKLWSEETLSLDSGEVKSFNSYIEHINSQELILNYNHEKMEKLDIYPGDYKPLEEDPWMLEYLVEHFENLKVFVKESAEGDYGLLLIFL